MTIPGEMTSIPHKCSFDQGCGGGRGDGMGPGNEQGSDPIPRRSPHAKPSVVEHGGPVLQRPPRKLHRARELARTAARHLPLRATPHNRVGLSFLVGGVTVAIYSASNEIVAQLNPLPLPMLSWEADIPLLPWTFWIYSTVYFIYFASCFVQQDLHRLTRFLNAYVVAYLAAGAFFVFFPTSFPREAFPLDGHTGLSARALELFRSLDHPTNCLPSMHVASGVMSAAPFYRRRPHVFVFFCLWAVAIAVTTLTTKQHYFIDVVGGIVFGVVAALLTYRPSRPRPRTLWRGRASSGATGVSSVRHGVPSA